MMNNSYLNFFPLDALPQSCRCVVDEINAAYMTLPELSATIALSTISTAAQGAFDVDVPGLGRSPISTQTLIIAESGLGKTVVNKALGKPVYDFETEKAQVNRVNLFDFQSKMEAWQIQIDACKSALKKRLAKGMPTQETKDELTLLLSQKPCKPRKLQLLYSDITPTAIKQALSECWPNITISTDEGSIFFSGRMVSELALLNQAWDGSTIIVNRKDEEIFIEDPRVTGLIQAQDGVIQRYQARQGDIARDIGAYARLLPVQVRSNQGWRFRQDVEFEFKHLSEFHTKVRALLDLSVDESGEPVREKRLLKFSSCARESFFEMHNQIESAQQPGGWLSNAKDYASKITRNMARIAALLHLIEYGLDVEEISYDTLARACSISNFFTCEFLRLFTTPPEIPQPVVDADNLYQWMFKFAQKNGVRYVLRADMQKYSPYSLRKQSVCDAAIAVLMQQGRITSWTLGRTNYYDLYPAYPPDVIAAELAINQSRSRRKQ